MESNYTRTIMRAGYFKRQHAYFKKKRVPFNKGSKATMKTAKKPATRAIRGLTSSEEIPTISAGPSTSNFQIGEDSSAMLLRPRKLKKTDQNSAETYKGARTIDNEKLMDMMNQLYREHNNTARADPKFYIAKNEKWAKSAQKNVNFARNFEARCASAILRYNNGQGEALKQKLLALGVQLAPSALRALDKIGQDMRAHRRQNATERKKSVIRRRGDLEFRHRRYRASQTHRTSDYRQQPSDHPYASTSGTSVN